MIFGGDPADGIPAVCWKIAPDVTPGYSLYDVADRLRMRGWQVPAYSMPGQPEGPGRAAHPRADGIQAATWPAC